MVAVFQSPITADEVKTKAKELGADLAGIADGAVMNANPPYPDDPKTPADISDHDADRVIVAKGTTANTRLADDLKAAGINTSEIGDGTGVGYLNGSVADAAEAVAKISA